LPDDRTPGAKAVPADRGRSERAAVIPIHPFTGLLSVAHEQGWPVREIFRGFDFDADGRPVPGQYVSFLTAREILLRATRQGGPDLAAQSGARKALPNLGVIGLGVMSQQSLGEAIGFGLEFQALAGSMLNVKLRIEGAEASLVAEDLFGDEELRGFLSVDHLLTCVNALAHLPMRPLVPQRVELPGAARPELLAWLTRQLHCPVVAHAEQARVVFASDLLREQLRFSDSVTAQLARQACEKETKALGLDGRATSLRDRVAGEGDSIRSPQDIAAQLGVSTRTLHRMLAAEGLKYAELAEQARMQNARRLLASGMATEEVAIALDYSDGRSFRRAFERCFGESPAAFRRRGEGA
jgi:AraC-like DNA-binding protein